MKKQGPMKSALAGITGASAAVILGITAVSHQPVHATDKETKSYTTWSDYEGSADSAQYSALTQINKSNVAQLQQVWFYPNGNNGFRYGFNPVVVDGVMYAIAKNNNIAALDAVTGKEIWVHDNNNPRNITNRGINYWESKDRSDRRLFYSTNNMLHALDARTGKLVGGFGDHGNVDLREGLGRDPKSIRQIESGTPGRVFDNLLILGSATGEEYNSPPGDIRAYDVLTGKMVWIFHTVPHPGELGYDTWPKDAWKYIGGVNDWGGMSIDEKRGIAYFPLGSPTYDFYGADRTGTGLFGNCLLALDARTGKYLWHFQAVHHDLFDYDLTTSPKLLTVKHDGKMVDIVAVAGKNGFLYVLDRVTGKPIWPMVERPVPQSEMPGEHSWPTQPFPTAPPPFATQSFTPDDVDPYIADPAEREKIKQQLQNARNKGIFTPAGLTDTVEMPGNNGGGNWGSGAVDPSTGTVYIESKNAPSMIKLEAHQPKRPMSGSPETDGKILYIQNCQTCHTAELTGQPPSIPSLVNVVSRISADRVKSTIQNGASPMPAFTSLSEKEVDALVAYLSDPSKAHVPPDVVALLSTPRPPPPPPPPGTPPQRYWTGYGYMNSSDGLPANKPPWSTLTAYDLNKGTIRWQIPLGGVTELMAKGIKDTGSFWPRGGVVVTAGGLIFSGTISDATIRAYDKDSGKVLWEQVMPAGPEGIPAVFEVNGREYLAFSARPTLKALGPGGERQTSDAAQTQGFYVFALPDQGHK
jgi:quinoprotein glucose dehydrogenase